MKWSYKDFWWRPKFTFSTFTRDPNLQTPHLHKTQIYTSPNLHRSDLHKTKFTQPNIDIPKFTRLKFTQKLNPNSHRPKFTLTFLDIDFKISKNPNLLELRVHECVRHSSELYCSHVTYSGVTLSPLG